MIMIFYLIEKMIQSCTWYYLSKDVCTREEVSIRTCERVTLYFRADVILMKNSVVMNKQEFFVIFF